MSKEQRLIELISSKLPRSDSQENRVFESDCEIISIGKEKLLFNIDEFSAEDHFREVNGYVLGFNLAVGAMSDVFAAGGKPIFYGHSMTVCPSWSEEYVSKFSEGIGDALRLADCSFMGGDFGVASQWRYVASVIGTPWGRPIKRSGARVGDSIYSTGKFGYGNLEALLSLKGNKLTDLMPITFPVRMRESEIINDFASSCIDSSDGGMNSLLGIAAQSKVGITVKNIPITKRGGLVAKMKKLDPRLLFFAEAGEYELVFTVPKENVKKLESCFEKSKLTLFRIGEIEKEGIQIDGIRVDGALPRARDYRDMEQYIRDLNIFIRGENE